MRLRENYRWTIYACYISYITQAIVNNFTPLLYLTFQHSFEVSLEKISLIIVFNFGTQLLIDLLSSFVMDRIGYRRGIQIGNTCAVLGLVLMGILPRVMDPFTGILIAVIFCGIGGGMAEVLVSPIVEACPTDDKVSAMGLLHSFYCWGAMGVILISTAVFALVGIEAWPWMVCVWALVPAANVFLFSQVPIYRLPAEEVGGRIGIGQLVRKKVFWLLAVAMLCAGASELAMAQWASAFVESALGVNKTVGDIAGPCAFAFLMALARVFYSKMTDRISNENYLLISTIVCAAGYLLTTLTPWTVVSLIGCALAGIGVASLWPGTFSLMMKVCPEGGTTMFALMALFGDAGCSVGPALVGCLTPLVGGSLKNGLLLAIVFPLLAGVSLLSLRKK